MGPLERRVYLALKRLCGQDCSAQQRGSRNRPRLFPGPSRNDMLLGDVEFEGTLDSCLSRVLEANGLYRKIDEKSGWG